MLDCDLTSNPTFNPNGPANPDAGIFGLPHSREQAKLILLPVPWEVTTSYGAGAALGPEAISQASEQLDLFDIELGRSYEAGYHMLPISEEIHALSKKLKVTAQTVIKQAVQPNADTVAMERMRSEVNAGSAHLNQWVYEQSRAILQQKKLLGVVGGDHSVPFGAYRALWEVTQGNYGILHIDAHADLRDAYQGFQHSHASIMHNLMTSAYRPRQLVQVGIRDFCEEEYEFAKSRTDIQSFYDHDLAQKLSDGTPWSRLCAEIFAHLPENIYVSCDIDGLQPNLCPNTGTPVPGGLTFHQFTQLLGMIEKTGKKLIGFDLVEVAPEPSGANDWDGNVGARVLYKLCGWTTKSNASA